MDELVCRSRKRFTEDNKHQPYVCSLPYSIHGDAVRVIDENLRACVADHLGTWALRAVMWRTRFASRSGALRRRDSRMTTRQFLDVIPQVGRT
jgi:hypothetical protein